MSLLTRKRVLLAKIESVYGTDPNPTGAANCILVRNLNTPSMEMQTAERGLVRPYFGNYESLPSAIHRALEFEAEIAGSGTAGTAPAWAPLLRACGFAETLLAAAHTGTAAAGAASTITLAAGASAVDDAYNHMTIRITGGTGSGQARVIKDYVGATKVATVTEAWTTAPDATSTYSIDAQAVYAPVSTGLESVAIYVNDDGVLRKMLGARGTVSLGLSNHQVPVFRFRFMGLWSAVTDTALPTTDYSGWQTPVAVNRDNTNGLRVLGFTAGALSELSVDVANELVFRSLIGATEQVLITDRKPAGNLTMEATTVAAKDWETAIKDISTGAFSVQHGQTAGNIVKIDAPKVQLLSPSFSDQDGILMMQANMTVSPVAGNDELVISVR